MRVDQTLPALLSSSPSFFSCRVLPVQHPSHEEHGSDHDHDSDAKVRTKGLPTACDGRPCS